MFRLAAGWGGGFDRRARGNPRVNHRGFDRLNLQVSVTDAARELSPLADYAEARRDRERSDRHGMLRWWFRQAQPPDLHGSTAGVSTGSTGWAC
ncbi:MAG: hypothetical protein LBB58_05355 [Cellulomonadaceae bacterium]|nr:hypothetical protein [Cellulomonadaceae bacterium]